ncbi:MAG: SDR family oxidoreductase, partial [Pseudomonadota bacterium]
QETGEGIRSIPADQITLTAGFRAFQERLVAGARTRFVANQVDTDAWRQCLDVCLDAQMFGCRRAVPVMKDQKSGSIINISSTAGLYGFPLRTPYAAAKWGVIGLTKSVAAEVGPYNIRCNAICPGAVAGPRIDRVISAEARTSGKPEEEVREAYASNSSRRRFVEASEIADMTVFLASPGAAMVSGEAISVDGHTQTLSAK